MTVTVRPLTGNAARAAFNDLAALRIAVFREFPYLYAGDLDYERAYLSTYAESDGGVIVVAQDDDRIIGAATALPLVDETPEVLAPFEAADIDPGRVFYLGESVLLPEYRGRGLGHAFFDHREARAREMGCDTAAFCAVQRPEDHPRRPAGYQPLDPFWHKRGYEKRLDMVTHFSWKDLDEEAESPKPMVFWLRRL